MGIAGLEFPAKHCMGDEHGRELNYGIASIYQFQPHFQALLEFDGPHAFTGAEAGTNVLNISPGIKSLHGHHWQMGVSLAAPVTKAKE